MKDFAIELNNYLNKHINDANFWNRNPIGKVIKEFCEGRGNFKNAPRSNPRKGYSNMISKINENVN
jgi:hypothetical protein